MKKGLLLLVIAVLGVACGSSGSDTPSTPDDTFDRGKILTNVADNLVIPAFTNVQTKLSTLKSKATAFTTTATSASLNEARTAWLDAYKAWQHVAMFNIGKAEDLEFVNFMNIFPVTKADIDANIASGTYDFNSSNNHDAQGFPALDYLFYGVGANDTEILAKYTTDAKAANYKKYVNDVISKMIEVNDAVLNNWKGSYRDTFVKSTGNTATSAFNKLVNDYVFYYEKRLRAVKVGIPAGNFSSTPLPEKVEAFYRKDVSKALALEALKAVKNLFNGTHFSGSTSGDSFKSYLEALDKGSLVGLINGQFDIAKTQLESLNDNFYWQVTNDNTKMTKAYDELQKAVVLLKVDMLQAFKVTVDYVDADGD